MRDLFVLTGRHLRVALRSRLAWVLALVFIVAAHAGVILVPDASSAAGTIAVSALLALVFFVFSVSAGAGNVLPEDRRTKADEWLECLAPPAWKHRLSCVVAGWVLCLGVAIVGGAVASVVTSLWASDFTVRDVTAVDLAQGARIARADDETGPGAPRAFAVPGDGAGRTLALSVRPRPRDPALLVDRVDLDWRGDDGSSGAVTVSVWQTMRLDVPARARSIELRNHSTDCGLFVRSSEVLGPARPLPLGLFWFGLWTGLMGAAAVPVAVFVSRFASGAVAGAAGFSVLFFGAVKAPMLELAEALADATWASVVLQTAALMTPDIGLLRLVGAYAAGRWMPADAWRALPGVLGYAAVGTVLACVALPARWRGTSA